MKIENYQKPNTKLWTGRISKDKMYLHEKIQCIPLDIKPLKISKEKTFAFLGYQCDEGVLRNQGRIGAFKGPDMIRKMLAPLANHFTDQVELLDVGNIICPTGDLEKTQQETSITIANLLKHQIFPIILGGGHDLAYAHYSGIKRQLPHQTIGIINLDAHFDLRKKVNSANSGTPFYQIASETNNFNYLCLGIQKAANNKELYKTANILNVQYVENTEFTIGNKKEIDLILKKFIESVDYLYLTIDLDGFSSSVAPGVSAPSPTGFLVDIAMDSIHTVCKSNKLISVDIVELNPKYDIDNCTAKLAARLIYNIISFI
ncbi:formiminoglutamase [Aquimarina aggregata]|uniref:Formimidoylglutamase n=1 Tax=Aquimarina aggregata TaxID=1642818 RepID=A0A163C3T6_9FLAO|nr:formimidoylglutamase [Aquimarina aggregata]KZS42031.1 formiminoglutamase [Aquimarina aggregata]